MSTQHLKIHALTGNTDHDVTGLSSGQLVYIQNPTTGVQSTGLYTDGIGALTATTIAATTLSGGTIMSAGTDLYGIFQVAGAVDGVASVNGSLNITTGGTATNPTIVLVDSPIVNNINFSGTAIGGTVQAGSGTFTSISAATLSGGTILSGSTNLYTLFTQGSGTVGTLPLWNGTKTIGNSLLTQSGTGVTVNSSVQIYGNVDILGTATTFNTTTVQTSDNNITLNLSGSHVSALGGGITVLSGRVDNSSSTWSVNAIGNWEANGAILSTGVFSTGNITGSGITSTGTIISGSTDLYDIFAQPSQVVNNVNSGSNITIGGTATSPIVNLTASPSIDNITFSGTAIGGTVQAGAGTFTSLSATTLSGGTILSGGTNLENIFTTGVGTIGTLPLWTGTRALANSLLTQTGTGVTVNGSVYIYGNVDILGTATTFNTTTVQTSDNNITLNLSGSHITAVGGGITVLSGKADNSSSTWATDVVGGWIANGNITTSGLTSYGPIVSGSTDLYNIFTNTVSAGSNITMGGTAINPIVNLTASPSVSSFTASGTTSLQVVSGTTVHANLFFDMVPYTGIQPLTAVDNNVWFHSGATGIITLNYKIGGATKSVELS